MAEPRAKTLQERMGFVDNDLKTPEHDKIMKWLDQWDFMLVESLVYAGLWEKESANLCSGHTADDLLDPGYFTTERKTWEVPVWSGKYIVGFLDMVMTIGTPVLYNGGRGEHSPHKIAFEVKTAVPSLGALLRQLSLYRAHLPRETRIVVVCPGTLRNDQNEADILIAQGYAVVDNLAPPRTRFLRQENSEDDRPLTPGERATLEAMTDEAVRRIKGPKISTQ